MCTNSLQNMKAMHIVDIIFSSTRLFFLAIARRFWVLLSIKCMEGRASQNKKDTFLYKYMYYNQCIVFPCFCQYRDNKLTNESQDLIDSLTSLLASETKASTKPYRREATAAVLGGCTIASPAFVSPFLSPAFLTGLCECEPKFTNQ